MKSPVIKVALTDDHPLIMEGVARLIDSREDMAASGQYTSGAALLEALTEGPLPDILLLDISLPDTTGNELARTIHKTYPELRMIALTSMDAPFQIKDMMQHGCQGYLLKSADPSTIIEAITTVYAGEQYLPPDIKERMMNAAIFGKPKSKSITKREQEILTMICAGEKNAEIAKKLFLSNSLPTIRS